MTEIKLKDINALVIDESSARKAAILKWEEIARLLDKARTLYQTYCGFCALTEYLAVKQDVEDTCELCPDAIERECSILFNEFHSPLLKVDEHVENLLSFLRGYIPTDGSHRT